MFLFSVCLLFLICPPSPLPNLEGKRLSFSFGSLSTIEPTEAPCTAHPLQGSWPFLLEWEAVYITPKSLSKAAVSQDCFSSGYFVDSFIGIKGSTHV